MDSDTSLEAENEETKSCSSRGSEQNENDAQYNETSSELSSVSEDCGSPVNESAENKNFHHSSDNESTSSSNKYATNEVTNGNSSPDEDDLIEEWSSRNEITKNNGESVKIKSYVSSPYDASVKSEEELNGLTPEHDKENRSVKSKSYDSSSDSEESTSSEKHLSEDGFRMLDKESELIKKEYMSEEQCVNCNDNNSQHSIDSVAEDHESTIIADEDIESGIEKNLVSFSKNKLIEYNLNGSNSEPSGSSHYREVAINNSKKDKYGSNVSLDNISDASSVDSHGSSCKDSLENTSKQSLRSSSSPDSISSPARSFLSNTMSLKYSIEPDDISKCNNLVRNTDSQCHEINDNDGDSKRNENYNVDKENQEENEKVLSPLSVHITNENGSLTGSPTHPRHQKLELEEINSNPDQSPKKCIINFGGQLSDVSDIESDEEDINEDDKPKVKSDKKSEVTEENSKNGQVIIENRLEDAVNLNMEKDDQLDFEVEDGEYSGKEDHKTLSSLKKCEVPMKKAEKEDEELEEGELADDDEMKVEINEPRLICKFYNRGQCTWGSNCRFIHPGVIDKGNYSMFDSVHTLPATAVPSQPHLPSVLYSLYPSTVPIVDRLGSLPATTAVRKEKPAESAWERGLRQAKEMIQKSSKRKETEVDFEDRKMNLTLGQEKIDKENDYYSRHSSPSRTPHSDNWKESDHKAGHKSVDNYSAEYTPHPEASSLPYYPLVHHGIPRADYWNPHKLGGLPYDEYVKTTQTPYGQDYYSNGRRYMHPNAYYARTGIIHPSANAPFHSDYYDRKQKFKQYSGSSAREVIVQKNDKSYKDASPSRFRGRRDDSPVRTERNRGDEWADPWMRSKSPVGRGRQYKKIYSSKSSYSSSSESSHSSSRSSYSSNSKNSKSASRSSGSRSLSSSSSPSNSRKRPPIQFKLSPSSRVQLPQTKKGVPKPISPILSMDKRIMLEKQMSPLVSSPNIKRRPFSPPVMTPNTITAPPPVGIPTKPPTPPPISMKTKNIFTKLLPQSKDIAVVPVRISKSKSKSSSGSSSNSSSSSDSSSESSGSSDSESSSSKSSSSLEDRHPKRISVDESIREQNLKGKSMDALKLSGQKQQIKLTLKRSANGRLNPALKQSPFDTSDLRRDRLLPSRKRHAISADSNSDSDKSARKGLKGVVPSRREELLKQLKAVEDAIARKRSKIP